MTSEHPPQEIFDECARGLAELYQGLSDQARRRIEIRQELMLFGRAKMRETVLELLQLGLLEVAVALAEHLQKEVELVPGEIIPYERLLRRAAGNATMSPHDPMTITIRQQMDQLLGLKPSGVDIVGCSYVLQLIADTLALDPHSEAATRDVRAALELLS